MALAPAGALQFSGVEKVSEPEKSDSLSDNGVPGNSGKVVTAEVVWRFEIPWPVGEKAAPLWQLGVCGNCNLLRLAQP